MAQLLVAGLFAASIAAIYILGTKEAIELAIACKAAAATSPCDKAVTDIPHLSYILTTLGNVISGGVVGVLAITRRDELPAERLLNGSPESIAKSIAAHIPLAFIVVWLFCGLATVYWGLINNAETIPALTAQAKGFIGSAATAFLAYLAPAPGSRVVPPPNGG